MKKIIFIFLLFLSLDIYSQYGIFTRREGSFIPITDTSDFVNNSDTASIAWRNRGNTFTKRNTFDSTVRILSADTVLSLRAPTTSIIASLNALWITSGINKDIIIKDRVDANHFYIVTSSNVLQLKAGGIVIGNFFGTYYDFLVPIRMVNDSDYVSASSGATASVTTTGQKGMVYVDSVSVATGTNFILTMSNAVILAGSSIQITLRNPLNAAFTLLPSVVYTAGKSTGVVKVIFRNTTLVTTWTEDFIIDYLITQ